MSTTMFASQVFYDRSATLQESLRFPRRLSKSYREDCKPLACEDGRQQTLQDEKTTFVGFIS